MKIYLLIAEIYPDKKICAGFSSKKAAEQYIPTAKKLLEEKSQRLVEVERLLDEWRESHPEPKMEGDKWYKKWDKWKDKLTREYHKLLKKQGIGDTDERVFLDSMLNLGLEFIIQEIEFDPSIIL